MTDDCRLTTGGAVSCALCLFGEARKGARTRDGEFGEAFAVERDSGVLQSVYQLPVRETVLARGRVDAHDPETAEIAFLAAAADKRVFQRGIDRLFGCAIQLALVGVIPFRQAKQLLALRP